MVKAFFEPGTLNDLRCAERRCEYICSFFISGGVEDGLVEYQYLANDTITELEIYLPPGDQRGCSVVVLMFPRIERPDGGDPPFLDYAEVRNFINPPLFRPSPEQVREQEEAQGRAEEVLRERRKIAVPKVLEVIDNTAKLDEFFSLDFPISEALTSDDDTHILRGSMAFIWLLADNPARLIARFGKNPMWFHTFNRALDFGVAGHCVLTRKTVFVGHDKWWSRDSDIPFVARWEDLKVFERMYRNNVGSTIVSPIVGSSSKIFGALQVHTGRRASIPALELLPPVASALARVIERLGLTELLAACSAPDPTAE